VEVLDAMDLDPGGPREVAADDRDVHGAGRRWTEPPQNGSRVVTEQRTVAAGERGGHGARERRLDRADEVDAAVDPAQPPGRRAMPVRG